MPTRSSIGSPLHLRVFWKIFGECHQEQPRDVGGQFPGYLQNVGGQGDARRLALSDRWPCGRQFARGRPTIGVRPVLDLHERVWGRAPMAESPELGQSQASKRGEFELPDVRRKELEEHRRAGPASKVSQADGNRNPWTSAEERSN